MYFNTNQFPELSFYCPHNKPNSKRVLGEHYNVCFDTKLLHGTCAIYFIPCVCTQCTYTIDKPCSPGVPPHQQPRYQPVKQFTYWPVLVSFNNFNIIIFYIIQHTVNILTK